MSSQRKDHWLLGLRAGWKAAYSIGLNSDDGLRLQMLPGSPKPLTAADGTLGGLVLPTGVVVDDQDRVYILDAGAGLIKRFDPCTAAFETLPCVGGLGEAPRSLRDPRGLALSHAGDLFIADTGNRRVQVFALKGFALRAIWGPLRVIRDGQGIHMRRAERPLLPPTADCPPVLGEYPDGTWKPYDVAITHDNRALVSDNANGLIHVFDRNGRWKTAWTGVSPDGTALEKPTRIALDGECRLYVLQENKSNVVILDSSGQYIGTVDSPESLNGRFCPVSIAIDKDGNLCLGDQFSRQLYVYSGADDSCQCAASVPVNFCGALAFDSTGSPIICDPQKKRVVCLAPQVSYLPVGRYLSEPLDSQTYHCQWHQIKLAGTIPSGTHLLVETFTSEALKTSEEVDALPPSRWTSTTTSGEIDGDWDTLVQSPPGRYLWLRLTFKTDGSATPEITWIEVHYPRLSSLRYLPAVFREDVISANFLDRFLSIFDTIDESIAAQIAMIARLFDPEAVPADETADFLTWLGSWLDMILDRHLSLERRRKLLATAWKLYVLRGTPQGLRLHIALCLGVEPHILEHFKMRRWLYLDSGRLGDQTLWGEAIMRRLHLDVYSEIGQFQLIDSGDPLRDPFYSSAHQFTLFLPLSGMTDAQRQMVERIVETSKPAHTQATIQVVEPRFRVGVQAFVGVDTMIGEYPEQTVTGEGKLGYDTVLPSGDDGTPTLRIGSQSRIGSSTIID